jgi:hypothetical protein
MVRASDSPRSGVGETCLRSAMAAFSFYLVLGLRRGDRLPLEVCDAIGSAASERPDVIPDVPGACAGQAARRGAEMLALELVLNRQRPILACRGGADSHRGYDRRDGESHEPVNDNVPSIARGSTMAPLPCDEPVSLDGGEAVGEGVRRDIALAVPHHPKAGGQPVRGPDALGRTVRRR